MPAEIVILSGPPAAGKNTIGSLIARQRERCAVIDVDLVRAMVVQPHRAPWQGEEGWRQQCLGISQTCQLASGFLSDGWDVIILDVVSARTLPLYLKSLAPARPFVVQLLPDLASCRARFEARGPMLTTEEFSALYEEQVAFIGYDLRIDNTDLSAATVAAQIDAAP